MTNLHRVLLTVDGATLDKIEADLETTLGFTQLNLGTETIQPAPEKSVPVVVEISKRSIAHLLVSGFEAPRHYGVGYWCEILDYRHPKVKPAESFMDPGVRMYECADYPLTPDGAVICYEHMDDSVTGAQVKRDPKLQLALDEAAIARGLALMPTKAPKAFAQLLLGDIDAPLADIFIQLCLLGELRYA